LPKCKQHCFFEIEYVEFCANKTQFVESFAFYFHLKKSAASQRMLSEADSDYIPSIQRVNTYFDAIKKMILN